MPRAAGIEMDRDEERVRVLIGECDALFERDEGIGAAGHDDLEPGGEEEQARAIGHIERVGFLVAAGAAWRR